MIAEGIDTIQESMYDAIMVPVFLETNNDQPWWNGTRGDLAVEIDDRFGGEGFDNTVQWCVSDRVREVMEK